MKRPAHLPNARDAPGVPANFNNKFMFKQRRVCARDVALGSKWHMSLPLSEQVHHAIDAPMSRKGAASAELPPRLRRTLELVYSVEGVVAARVWQCGENIAVGVRGGMATEPASLLHRVQFAVAGLREPDEHWDFGILEDAG